MSCSRTQHSASGEARTMNLGPFDSKSNILPLSSSTYSLTIYLIEKPFNTFANRVDPDQTALVRAA